MVRARSPHYHPLTGDCRRHAVSIHRRTPSLAPLFLSSLLITFIVLMTPVSSSSITVAPHVALAGASSQTSTHASSTGSPGLTASSPYSGKANLSGGGLLALGLDSSPAVSAGAFGAVGFYGFNSSVPLRTFVYTGGGSALSQAKHVKGQGSYSGWGTFSSGYLILGAVGGRPARVSYTVAGALLDNASSSGYIGGEMNVSGVGKAALPQETTGSTFALTGYVFAYPFPVSLSVYDSSSHTVEYSGYGHIISLNATLPAGLYYLVFKGNTTAVYTLRLSYASADPGLWYRSPGYSCYASQSPSTAAAVGLSGSIKANIIQSTYYTQGYSGLVTEVASFPVEVYTTYGVWEFFSVEEYSVLNTWNHTDYFGALILNSTGPTSNFTYGVTGPGSMNTYYEYGYYGSASVYYSLGGGTGIMLPASAGFPPTLALSVGVVKGEGVSLSPGYLDGSSYTFPFNSTILFPDAESAWIINPEAPAYYPYSPYGFGQASGIEVTVEPGSPQQGYDGLVLNTTGYAYEMNATLQAEIYAGGASSWAPASECYPYVTGLYAPPAFNSTLSSQSGAIFTAGYAYDAGGSGSSASPPAVGGDSEPMPGEEVGLALNITVYMYTPPHTVIGGKVLFVVAFVTVIGGGFAFTLVMKKRRQGGAGVEQAAGSVAVGVPGEAAQAAPPEPASQAGAGVQGPPQGEPAAGKAEEEGEGAREEAGSLPKVSIPRASYDYEGEPGAEEKKRIREEFERVRETVQKMLTILEEQEKAGSRGRWPGGYVGPRAVGGREEEEEEGEEGGEGGEAEQGEGETPGWKQSGEEKEGEEEGNEEGAGGEEGGGGEGGK